MQAPRSFTLQSMQYCLALFRRTPQLTVSGDKLTGCQIDFHKLFLFKTDSIMLLSP